MNVLENLTLLLIVRKEIEKFMENQKEEKEEEQARDKLMHL